MDRRRTDGRTFYGRAECLALIASRPGDIFRAFVREGSPEVRGLVHALVRARQPYREVTDDELERLAKSRHHEGVVLEARPRAFVPASSLLSGPGPAVLAWLSADINPHNLGAILRSGAHFGLRGFVVSGEPRPVAGAAARVAEGGAEVVPMAVVSDPDAFVVEARQAGFAIAATAADGDVSLFDLKPGNRRILWRLGHEGAGLSVEDRAMADAVVRIPGTGAVESLNLSVSAGVLFVQSFSWVSGETGA